MDRVARLLPSRRLRRVWSTLRADLHWLSRDLRGEKRPFLVNRSSVNRHASTTSSRALAPRPLRIAAVQRETEDAVTLELAEIDGSPLTFSAGQFLTFHLEVNGESLRRAYSLSSSPLDGPTATVTVKRIDDGRASGWIFANAEPGMELNALGPSGSFVCPAEATELVMIAGGSGITPVVSIAETVSRERPDTRVRLIYGNRREADIIFRARLDALGADHVLEAPPEDWDGRTGRLDADTLDGWLEEDDGRRDYFICGPEAMMDGAREALLSRGIDTGRIHEERFRSPEDTPRTDARLPEEPVTMLLRVAGRNRITPVKPGDTILEAGLTAGAAMPFSCAMGGCAACKCRLVRGQVVMEEPNCLSPEEREQGYVLACSSRPLTDIQVELS